MTDSEHEKVLTKIRALLNLAAEGSGATEAEASLAMERANALLLKWNLDAETVRAATGESIDVDYEILMHPGTVPHWQGVLAMAVGEANFCRPLHDHEYFYFVGRQVNRVAARDMFTWLRVQVDSLGIFEAQELVMPSEWPVGQKRAWKRSWKDSWYLGCANRIYARVKELNGSTGAQGLIISVERENSDFILNKWGRLRQGRSAPGVSNHAAYDQGMDAGGAVSMRDQGRVGQQLRLKA